MGRRRETRRGPSRRRCRTRAHVAPAGQSAAAPPCGFRPSQPRDPRQPRRVLRVPPVPRRWLPETWAPGCGPPERGQQRPSPASLAPSASEGRRRGRRHSAQPHPRQRHWRHFLRVDEPAGRGYSRLRSPAAAAAVRGPPRAAEPEPEPRPTAARVPYQRRTSTPRSTAQPPRPRRLRADPWPRATVASVAETMPVSLRDALKTRSPWITAAHWSAAADPLHVWRPSPGGRDPRAQAAAVRRLTGDRSPRRRTTPLAQHDRRCRQARARRALGRRAGGRRAGSYGGHVWGEGESATVMVGRVQSLAIQGDTPAAECGPC